MKKTAKKTAIQDFLDGNDYLDDLFGNVPPLLADNELTVQRVMDRYGKSENIVRSILNRAVLEGRYTKAVRRQSAGGYVKVYTPIKETKEIKETPD